MKNRIAAGVLGLVILAVISTIIYFHFSPPVKETFTEFYVSGWINEETDRPIEPQVGAASTVKLGIINRQGRVVSYRAKVSIGGNELGSVGPKSLDDGEQWEPDISFVPRTPGDRQQIEFRLYEDGDTQPVSVLYLWLDIKA